ncbi:PAS domain-containing protein [Streptomyces mirabilis]|uniref:PAS domain-containing protein n=1 Tax=Streptomyces mirabilis TaxID=68239 RepID=UPI00367F84C2
MAAADIRGVLTGWSQRARQLLGYDDQEALGRAACGLLASGDPAEVWHSLAGRQSWSGTVVLRHRDGHRVQGELMANRRVQAQGVDWLLVWVHRKV